MKIFTLSLALSALLIYPRLFAQIQVDHAIQLTGSGSNAKVMGIQQSNQLNDATNVQTVQNNGLNYSIAGGTGNAITVSLTPTPSGYVAGMLIYFKATANNTGAATLNVNSLGLVTIKKQVSTDLAAGDIKSGQMVAAIYDGTNFQLIAGGSSSSSPCSANAGTASASSTNVTCGSTITLTLTGYSGNLQWQQSADGIYFTNIAAGINASQTTNVYAPIMYYLAYVNNGSCTPSYSNILTVNATGCSAIGCSAIGWTGGERAYSIIKTSDGGYALAGYTQSFGAGGQDMYVVKLDNMGNVSWTRTIGGTQTDVAQCIIQTSDGGYAVAGYTQSFGAGSVDMYLAKLDASGNVSWTKTLGGTNQDYGESVVQATDGGYVMTGYTTSFGGGSSNGQGALYIAKFDGSGNLLWTKTVGGSSSGTEQGSTIINTSDGGYAVAGTTASYGSGTQDMYAVKFDASGNVSWTRTMGGSNTENGQSIVQTSDGGYAVAGSTFTYGAGSNDMFIVKLTSTGTVSWSTEVGGTQDDYAYAIVQTTDGGYAVAGRTASFGAGGYDMYLAKLTSAGALSWSSTAGGTKDEYAYSMVQTSDGGFALAGYTQSFGPANGTNYNMYIVKLSSTGTGCCGVSQTSTLHSSGLNSTGGSGTSSSGTAGSGGSPGTGGTRVLQCD